MEDSVAVYVSTWDRYRAAWPVLCRSLAKYWPDRPWPLYFATNRLDPPCGEALKTGRDTNWTVMQRKALKQLEHKVILFLEEDYWLTEPVDSDSLVEFARLVLEGKARRIHLCTGSHTNKATFSLDGRLNVYADRSIYRTSLQAALWDRAFLVKMLKGKETPWQFETDGNRRSFDIGGFLNVKEHRYIRYVMTCLPEYKRGAIVRGRWTPDARKYAETEGFKVDFSTHPKDERCR